MSPRLEPARCLYNDVPTWLVASIGTNHKVAGSLVLLFEEVVESLVNVWVSNGSIVDISPIVTLGASQISLLLLHWQVPERITIH